MAVFHEEIDCTLLLVDQGRVDKVLIEHEAHVAILEAVELCQLEARDRLDY